MPIEPNSRWFILPVFDAIKMVSAQQATLPLPFVCGFNCFQYSKTAKTFERDNLYEGKITHQNFLLWDARVLNPRCPHSPTCWGSHVLPMPSPPARSTLLCWAARTDNTPWSCTCRQPIQHTYVVLLKALYTISHFAQQPPLCSHFGYEWSWLMCSATTTAVLPFWLQMDWCALQVLHEAQSMFHILSAT
jgi:hypothetical protein